jgi:hypothetical protein
MARKFDHSSKPAPRTSPAINNRKVIVAAHGNASVGHSQFSGRRGRCSNNILGQGDNGANLRAPGAMGPPVTGVWE